MIKLVWRSDVHLSDRAPASRKDDWTETVFNKLMQTRIVAEKLGAHGVLDGGDFFHVKSPSRNSHALLRRVAELHKTFPCPIYCTPGNHDSVYGDYNYLHQQPLGVLYASGVFRPLYDQHEAVFVDPESGVKVRVIGVPYHGTQYDMSRFFNITRGDEDYLVVVAHVLASLKGGTMFEGEDIVSYNDLMGVPADAFLFGHWHKDQGAVEIGGKWFVNIGSLTRGSIAQDDLIRQPACAVLSFVKEKMSIQVVRLRVQPSSEVFDVEGRAKAKDRATKMDSFVENIRGTLAKVAGRDLKDAVEGMEGIPEAVRERSMLYLERADAE